MAKEKIKKYLFLLLLLTFLASIGAGSMRNQEIEVTGRIFVTGHEPFTQVAIELSDGRVFALMGIYDKELRSWQGKKLTIKGIYRGKTAQGLEGIEVKEFKIWESK